MYLTTFALFMFVFVLSLFAHKLNAKTKCNHSPANSPSVYKPPKLVPISLDERGRRINNLWPHSRIAWESLQRATHQSRQLERPTTATDYSDQPLPDWLNQSFVTCGSWACGRTSPFFLAEDF